ncbi:hypothetical protein D3C85_1617790 [compost metagenome]
MVNVFGAPAQFPEVAVGVTVIVAVIGVEPLFLAVKAGKLPFPEAAKLIVVLLLVHL